MDSLGHVNESTPLRDCSSYEYDTFSNERSLRHAADQTKKLAHAILNCFVSGMQRIATVLMVACVVTTALVYLVIPTTVHAYMRGGYLDLPQESDVTHPKENTSAPILSSSNANSGSSSCSIPQDVKTLPAIPILPANVTMDTVCYGANTSSIKVVTQCLDILGTTKAQMGYGPLATQAKVLYGLEGDFLFQMLNIGFNLLFGFIEDKWPDCTPYAKRTICQFFFPPVVEDGNTILALNKTWCSKTRDVKCHKGWQEAVKVISKFVDQCGSAYPILKLLHMPICEDMPDGSVITSPTCTFSGINFSGVGSKCYKYKQYPMVSLIVQDFVFLVTMVGGALLAVAGFVLPCFMSRVTGQVFPYFVLPIKAGLLSMYSLFLLVLYFSFTSTSTQGRWFCQGNKETTMVEAFQDHKSTDVCKVTVVLFQFMTLSVTGIWMASLILASVRMGDGGKNPKPSVGRRFSNVGLALFICFLCIIPSVVNMASKERVVIPRRPTVMCTFEDANTTFFAHTLPLLVMTFVGIMLLMRMVINAQKELSLVRTIDQKETVARELQYFPLKSVLRFLLFHILMGLVIVPFAALSFSTQMSVKIFSLELLFSISNKLGDIEKLPIWTLMGPVIFGYLSVLILLVHLIVTWCYTKYAK